MKKQLWIVLYQESEEKKVLIKVEKLIGEQSEHITFNKHECYHLNKEIQYYGREIKMVCSDDFDKPQLLCQNKRSNTKTYYMITDKKEKMQYI